jgi:hypothetical protein
MRQDAHNCHINGSQVISVKQFVAKLSEPGSIREGNVYRALTIHCLPTSLNGSATNCEYNIFVNIQRQITLSDHVATFNLSEYVSFEL